MSSSVKTVTASASVRVSATARQDPSSRLSVSLSSSPTVSFRHGAVSSPSVSAFFSAPFPNNAYHRLRGWWRADTLGKSDGDIVSTWPDRSDRGNDLEQIDDPSSRPYFRIDHTNSVPYVEFLKSRGFFFTSKNDLSVEDTPLTVIALIRPHSQSMKRELVGSSRFLSLVSDLKEHINESKWSLSLHVDPSDEDLTVFAEGGSGFRHYQTPIPTRSDGQFPWLSVAVSFPADADLSKGFSDRSSMTETDGQSGSMTPQKSGKLSVGYHRERDEGLLGVDLAELAVFEGNLLQRQITDFQSFLMDQYHRPHPTVSVSASSSSVSAKRKLGVSASLSVSSTVEKADAFSSPEDVSSEIYADSELLSHLSDGDPVYSWGKLTGHRDQFPVLKDGVFNSHPGVVFDESDQFLASNPDTVDLTSGPFSLYMLGKVKSAGSPSDLISVGNRDHRQTGARSLLVQVEENASADRHNLIVRLNPDFEDSQKTTFKDVIPKNKLFLLTIFLEDTGQDGIADSITAWVDEEMNVKGQKKPAGDIEITPENNLSEIWRGAPSKGGLWIGQGSSTKQSYGHLLLISGSPDAGRRDLIWDWINRHYD